MGVPMASSFAVNALGLAEESVVQAAVVPIFGVVSLS